MILRLSDSLSRALVVAAALLVGLWLSFFGIRAAIARHDSEQETAKRMEAAVRLEPNNPEYWYGRYQQYNLEEPDAVLAEGTYRKTIALNPEATEAWLDLATAYELDGKTEEAREAYLQAKKSYPVSADVAWRYGNFLLRQGEGEQALAYAELRRAIEADPQRAAEAFSRAYRTNPNIDELLGLLLPPEQSVYVDVIWEALGASQLAVAKTVWAQLLTTHPHLGMRDVDHFVSELLQAGEFAEARRVWDQGMATMNLPPLLQPRSSVVWDPSFETDMNGNAFSWHYVPLAQGVSIGLDKTEKLSGNQSLRLSFDGKHDPDLEAACTLAIVQPSTTYRFSGWIKTKAITSDQGIGFRLGAIGGASAPVVNSRQVLDTNPWTLLEQSWTSGADVHRVQICVTRDASENPEVRISGTAWVDDVNLLPQPAEKHKP
jgi:Tfp pilus assembly protein PilF